LGILNVGGELMAKKHIVALSKADRRELERIIHSGTGAARRLTHARILLKADSQGENWTDEQIAEALESSISTVERVRGRYCREGLQKALEPRPQPPRPQARTLDGAGEARLSQLACSTPPEGHEHWTLRLLADRMVQLHYVEAISYESVRRSLSKTR
jgi:transposase